MQPAIATNSAEARSHTGVFVNRSATNTARNPTAMKKMAMLAGFDHFRGPHLAAEIEQLRFQRRRNLQAKLRGDTAHGLAPTV